MLCFQDEYGATWNAACDYPACSGHIRFGCGGDHKCYYDRYDEDCIGKPWGENGCFHDGRPDTQAADDGSDRPGKRSWCPPNMAAKSEAEQAAAGSQSWMTNVAFPNPANFSRPLSTFQASEVYESRQSYNIQLDGLSAGQHYMYAYAGAAFGRSSGWHGGWFELKDQFGDRVAGGEVDGVVEGEKLQVDFVVEEGNMEVGCICRSPCSNKYMRGGRERTSERWHCEPRNSRECDMEMFNIRSDGRGNLRECTVDGYTLNIRTEWRASDVSWQLDDGSQYSGPHKAPIYIGAKANLQDDASFVGSMAGIQISGSIFPRNTVECMYLAAEEKIGRCADPRGVVFKADLLAHVDGTPPKTYVSSDWGEGITCDPGYIFQRADGQDGRPQDNACGALGGCVNKAELDGQVCGKACDRDCANLFDMADSVATADITMYGETHLDRDFGAILDGVGDFLTFEDTGFTAAGQFTIGFWFTRNTECANPGRWQYLYSEAEDPDAAFYATEDTAIEIYLACGQGDNDGDVIRTYVQDDCGTRGVFDVELNDVADGGPITSLWIHYLLAVSRDAMQLHLNGEKVPDSGTAFSSEWLQGSDNAAWPTPSQLNTRFCSFGLSEMYGGYNDDGAIALDLMQGVEYFLRWQPGANGQFWVTSEAGRTSCSSDACAFVEATPARWPTPAVAAVEEGCTVVPGTAEQEAAAATTCALTAATAASPGSCAAATGSGCCNYIAAVDAVEGVVYAPANPATCTGESSCATNDGDVVPPTDLTGIHGSVTFTATGTDRLTIVNSGQRWDANSLMANEMKWSITTDQYHTAVATARRSEMQNMCTTEYSACTLDSGCAAELTEAFSSGGRPGEPGDLLAALLACYGRSDRAAGADSTAVPTAAWLRSAGWCTAELSACTYACENRYNALMAAQDSPAFADSDDLKALVACKDKVWGNVQTGPKHSTTFIGGRSDRADDHYFMVRCTSPPNERGRGFDRVPCERSGLDRRDHHPEHVRHAQ